MNFDITPWTQPIVPVMLYDARLAQNARSMMNLGASILCTKRTFAAFQGEAPFDGDKNTSLYTSTLLKYLKKKGVDIDQIFKDSDRLDQWAPPSPCPTINVDNNVFI